MNKERRNALYKIVNTLDEKSKELEKIRDEEQDCYDNLPEGLVDSERGEAMSENCDDLDSAVDSLEEVIDYIKGVIMR